MLLWIGRIGVGVAAFAAVCVLLGLIAVWFFFSAGQRYPDLTSEPLLPESALEQVFVSDAPVGAAAVTEAGRLFYTVHPAGAHGAVRLFERVGGGAVPFPAAEVQKELFQTPLGLALDGRNWLWVIDSGRYGLGSPRLLAFDLDSGAVAHRIDLPRDVAPRGSFLQDLAVSSDGDWVYIADAGVFSRRPGLVVYSVRDQRAHKVLVNHETVQSQDWVIETPFGAMVFLGGLFSLKAGVDGIALGPSGEWLYYAAMNHDTMYRVPVSALQNPNTPRISRAVEIRTVGRKPISDGIALDAEGQVFVTDVEHQAVMRITPEGKLETVIRDPRIRWPGGLAAGPEGWIYLADSALQEVVLKDAGEVAARAPFTVWRFRAPEPPPPPDPMLPPRFTQ